MCRLAVQHGAHHVDLMLPMDTPVGLLLPSVVDLVDTDGAGGGEPRRWYLSRLGQARLDEATSLRDNAIHDGELLVLTMTSIPAPVRMPDDPYQVVADAADARSVPTMATTVACLSTAAFGATGLAWAGVVTEAIGHTVTAGAIAAAAFLGAVAARRLTAEPISSISFSVIAVVFGAVAGFVAVPSGPSTANQLLAAAIVLAVSIALLRITRCGTTCVAGLATFGALTTTASACGVVWQWPVDVTGAVVATLALGLLGVAARLSIAATGLAPPVPITEEDFGVATQQAISAHRLLTGLVIGSAAAAALGAILVALGGADEVWARPVAFVTVVAVVLMLRARTHVAVGRRAARVAGGMAAVAAGCALVVISAPDQAYWVCLLVTAIGLTPLGRTFGVRTHPLARRAIDVLEYAALGAVIPLACWVGGLYGFVRGLSL